LIKRQNNEKQTIFKQGNWVGQSKIENPKSKMKNKQFLSRPLGWAIKN